MDELGQLIRNMVTDVIDGEAVPSEVAEGLADSLGIGEKQVEELAGELKVILSEEQELEAIARADSVDQVIASLSSLLVELKG